MHNLLFGCGTTQITWNLDFSSTEPPLSSINSYSKGHLDECLVIANAKVQYGRVGKKARPILLEAEASRFKTPC